jgi:uncharacterized membrane protein YdjX (TVP38/TMEM64 family)
MDSTVAASDQCASQPLASRGETGERPPLKKALFLAALLGILLAVVYFSPLRQYLGRAREISDGLRRLGFIAPIVLTFGVAALVAAGFSRLLLCVISGMTLGFWPGLFWAQVGSLLGNYATFLAVRWGGGEWARRYLTKRRRWGDVLRQGSLPAVLLARQLPVPGIVVNLALGLSPLSHRDFLIGTAVGQIPEAIPCTLIGAGVMQGSFTQSASVVGIAVAILLLAWMGVRSAIRRSPPCLLAKPGPDDRGQSI